MAVPTLHLVHFRQQSRDKNNTVIKQNKVARQYNCASRISCFFSACLCLFIRLCLCTMNLMAIFFFYVLFYLNDIMYENLTSLHDRNLFVRMDKILVDPAINVQSFLSSCERYTVRTQLHTPSDMLLFEIMQINNWIAWWGLWIFFFKWLYIYIYICLSRTCHIIIIFFSIKLFLGIITVNPPEIWSVCTLLAHGLKLITLPSCISICYPPPLVAHLTLRR